jgi:hypothetical protein
LFVLHQVACGTHAVRCALAGNRFVKDEVGAFREKVADLALSAHDGDHDNSFVGCRISGASNQIACGWLILTINHKNIEVAIFDPGSGHTEIAARLDRDIHILQNSAKHLDGLGIGAHE